MFDRIISSGQKRIRIADRTDARRDLLDRIDHPGSAAGVEHIARQQGGQIVSWPAALHRINQSLRRAAYGHDVNIGKSGKPRESRPHIELSLIHI